MFLIANKNQVTGASPGENKSGKKKKSIDKELGVKKRGQLKSAWFRLARISRSYRINYTFNTDWPLVSELCFKIKI